MSVNTQNFVIHCHSEQLNSRRDKDEFPLQLPIAKIFTLSSASFRESRPPITTPRLLKRAHIEVPDLTERKDKEILCVTRMPPQKKAEVDTVTIVQKATAKARRAVSAMSREAQEESARQGTARLYQTAGHGEAKAVRC